VNTLYTQLVIGRLVLLSSNQLVLKPVVAAIEADFSLYQQSSLLASLLQFIYWLTAFFWAYPLFDTSGASNGWREALWVALIMCTAPLWLQLPWERYCRAVLDLVSGKKRPTSDVMDDQLEVTDGGMDQRDSEMRFETRETEMSDIRRSSVIVQSLLTTVVNKSEAENTKNNEEVAANDQV
jgi:hypothetical protein